MSRPRPRPRLPWTARLLVPGTLTLVGLLAGPAPAWAQAGVLELAASCAGGDASLEDPCLEAALAAEATRGIVGLSAGSGPSLLGGSSTLGARFSGAPRLAVAISAGVVDGAVPRPRGGGLPPDADPDLWVSSLRADAALGLFDGFSPAPTVGGVLAVDLVGSLSTVLLPDDGGFDGSTSGGGVGVRVGVLRESFTLPGVTLSVSRRWLGRVRVGDPDIDGAEAETDVRVTSLRATAGKEFLAFGILGGVGWDRYGGHARVAVVPDPRAGGATARGETDFSQGRLLLYGGLSYTFLVARITLDGGYAGGFDAVPGRTDRAYDPEAGSVWARLGARLTF